jgi:uncharacterized repeat protein (TIGR01451 family)
VLKTGPTLALPDQLISYTIYYGNPGLLLAEGVRLTDTLPLSTTYVRDDSLLGTPLSGTLGAHDWVAWDVGAIPSDTAEISFTLVLSVSSGAPVGLPLLNTAVISSTSYDGNRLDNESQWFTPVGFDLSQSYKLVNGSAGAVVGEGEQVTYTVVLTNLGPYDAPGVLLQDPIPDDTAYAPGSLAAPGGDYGYDPAGDLITWTGTVSGNSAVNVSFQVTVAHAGPVPRGTVIYNTALISDGVQTFQPSVPLTVSGPDLENSYKTVNNPWPAQGERITYTIVIVNDGEIDASASLTDALPSEVLYTGDGQASSGSLGMLNPISWTGTVTAGQRVTITLPVTVLAEPGSEFANTAQIDDGAGVLILRSITASTAAPDLDVPATRKEASASAVLSGERVTYTITLYNGGDGATPWAWMQDVIQGGYYGGGGEASSGLLDASNAPTITWSGALASDESVVILIPVVITAPAGSDVSNVIQIGDGYNQAFERSALLHVRRLADISGSGKTANPTQARLGDTLDYLLTVRNSGEILTDFSVVDTLDSDTAFVGFVGTPPGSFGYAAGVITWTGAVEGGEQAQLTFQATISPSASVEVVNTATFADGAGGVYTRTASTPIVAPELAASKQVAPGGAVAAGAPLTYSLYVQNLGGDTARVHLSDTLPLHTIYEVGSAQASGTPIPPIYDGDARTLSWDGDLDPAQAVTITFRALVEPGTLAGSSIANVAWLQETSEPGPLFSVTTTNTVVAPDFDAAKWSSPPGNVRAGEVLQYGILLRNAQEGMARVVLTDAIPLNTTYISASAQVQSSDLPPLALLELLAPLAGVYEAPQYDAGNNRLTWSGDVWARTAVTLTFAVTVNQGVSVGALITNTAWVDELSDPAPALAYQAFNMVEGYEVYLPLVIRQ